MLSGFVQSWTPVLVLTPLPQAVSLDKRVTSLRLSFIIGKISELTWMSSVHPSSSSFQWVSSSPHFFCKHLENSDCAAKSESRYTWACVRLLDTIQGRCSGDSACALTPDKRKEKVHATVSLVVSLLSQVIWITAWPVLWTVKKNPTMLIQLDCVISARFRMLFWKWMPSVCINNPLALRPYDLHSGSISVYTDSQRFNEE